jgi:SAM-dependent methyltransferase
MAAMDEDRTRWDARYTVRREGPASSAVAPEALALLDEATRAQLPTTGRALDIACGTGAQSLWLAERGLDVLALDVSPVAVELTGIAAHTHGCAERIDARVHDLDAGLPPDAAGASIVVCQRFRDPALYPLIAAALRPGGVAMVTVLSAVGLDGVPGEFHAPPGELERAFTADGFDVLAGAEADGLASIVVRRY